MFIMQGSSTSKITTYSGIQYFSQEQASVQDVSELRVYLNAPGAESAVDSDTLSIVYG